MTRSLLMNSMYVAVWLATASSAIWTSGESVAATFDVTRTDDPAPDGCAVGDCSLREAIIASNASAGADTINLPAGTYTLTIPSASSDTDATIGDLDIGTGGLTIQGAGASTTTITAAGIAHRVFHLPVDLLIPNATVTINNVTITGGNTTGLGASFNRGGGIEAGSRFLTLNLNNVLITGNNSGSGGGLFSQCTLNVTDGTIRNNTGTGITHAADGTNFRTATITRCTISGNTGTGARNNAGTVNIINSTISGNGTGGGFAGGVDYAGGNTGGTLTNTTLAFNRYAFIGQNDFAGDPFVTFRNSILSNSTVRNVFSAADASFARPPGSGGNNIVSDNSGTTFIAAGDQQNTDPMLEALMLNSPGTTETHAITVSSPAFDNANAAFAPATDQRGVGRPQGGADDAGAFEVIPPDDDMDGFSPPADCDDADPNVNPSATEVFDGMDNNCDGTVDEGFDDDLDGFLDDTLGGNDCDDADPNVNPSAAETDNGIDDNCDGNVDEGFDGDSDGFTPIDGGDCDDADPNVNPGAAEVDNGIDDNCDGNTDEGFDGDSDGFTPIAGGDCDDADPNVNPGAAEVLDGADNNCDGTVDEGLDTDGVSAATEDAAPNNGDGNNDGTKDSLQDNVTSLPNTNGDFVTVAAPAGTTLSNVTSGANPSPADAPAGVTFPAGFTSFEVGNLPAGGAVDVDLIVNLPAGTTINTYWKFGPEPSNSTPHWYEFLFDGTTGATISGNVITLHLVDGLRGDDDLAVNGVIIDPGAPALAPANPNPDPDPNPGAQPAPSADCGTGTCGGGMTMMMPLTLLGFGWLGRRRR